MRTLVLTIGLPASGKSTWSRNLVKAEPGRWKRVSKDELRLMLDADEYNDENEKFVQRTQDSMIRAALKAGYDVVVDNTNLRGTARKKNHDIARDIGDVKVIEKVFHVDPDECLKRNSLRPAPVPDDVITNMYQKFGSFLNKAKPSTEYYYPPATVAETMVQDEALPPAIMCDLDGTLALIGDRSPYDASECDTKDHPNRPVIECVLSMHARGVKIIFMSGRDSKYREQTIRFIEQYCQVPANWAFAQEPETRPSTLPIPYELHMRAENDMRKDSIIKRELFDAHVRGKYNVRFVLDDRDQVVEAWRDMGLTVFQVAPGDF